MLASFTVVSPKIAKDIRPFNKCASELNILLKFPRFLWPPDVIKMSVLHCYLSSSLHVWASKYPQPLSMLRCPVNHAAPLRSSPCMVWCISPAIAKCDSSIQPLSLSISWSALLNQSSPSVPGTVGMLWLQSQRVIRPILSRGSEIDGFNLFCSDNAMVSPLTGKGSENNLARHTVFRQRKSPSSKWIWD